MRFFGPSMRWRRPLAWLAPLAAGAAFVAAGPIGGVVSGPASADLPARTAQQLLVDVQQSDVVGLSGTVEESVDLGLPDLPSGLTDSGSGDLAGLLTGTYALRVWTAGPRQSRIALPSQYGETDLVRNGRDLWLWTSSDHSAEHWTLPAHRRAAARSGPAALAQAPATPQEAANDVLAALDPSTVVTGEGTTVVAGRAAYVLQLVPRTAGTLVGSVRIAIDGETHLPTQVQVFARDATTPSLSVGFTSLQIGTPDPSTFTFTPPEGASVTEKSLAAGSEEWPAGSEHQGVPPAGQDGYTVGKGWTQVLVGQLPARDRAADGTLGQVLATLPTVSGSWGSGHLLQGPLLSAVLTDSGRLAVGAVPPAQLYAALAR